MKHLFVLILILSAILSGADRSPLISFSKKYVWAGANENAKQTASVTIPPLPTPDRNEEQVAIAVTDKGMTAAEIKQLLRKYPRIQLRKTFNLALNGFSVKGPQVILEKLAQDEAVQTVTITNHYIAAHPGTAMENDLRHVDDPLAKHFITNQYQAHAADNMELIGATTVQGILHSKLTGKGVKIGVIDTGVDYSHRDLKGNYRGGRDVVDGDTDPMETKGLFGQNTLHGTHVAGIIAANGQMKGVAPGASIYAYRALGPGGSGTSEQIIAAIERAIADKVDIINLSLGTNVNGPDLPLSLALNKAVEHGITAVTSSGNSGPNIWTVGTPGTASKAISVGASTPTLQIPYIMDRSGGKIKLELMQGSVPWDLNREYELVSGGFGKTEELENARGKIVLLERGILTFSEKVKNAAEAGAVAAIIFNNTNGPLLGNLEQVSPIPIMGITKIEGKRLLQEIKEGNAHVRTTIAEERDELAAFSSRGPVTDSWEIKPDVLAPGVAIQSTVPGGYIPMQGTSMAAPHVAGACALIKEAHPDWNPEQIKAALMNYAKPLARTNGELYRTYEQGAGRIQLKESLEAEVIAYPASLQFGRFQQDDTQHVHKATITIENISGHEQSISFSIPKHEPGIKWHIPPSFTLKADERRNVEIQLTADPQILKSKLRDGALLIHTDGKEIRIPYLFVLEEPDYPRVMGFDFGAGDRPGTFRYEVYLPGGAEEFGIALFDPDTNFFVQFLDWKRDVGRGLLRQEVPATQIPGEGFYLAKVFARKSGKEDTLDIFLPLYMENS